MEILTYKDAEVFTDNCGVLNWDWGGNASLKGFTDWIYHHCNELQTDDYEAELVEYLESVGEDPDDYSL